MVWAFLYRWFLLGYYGLIWCILARCTWFADLIVQLTLMTFGGWLFVLADFLTPKSLWYFTWMCLRLELRGCVYGCVGGW